MWKQLSFGIIAGIAVAALSHVAVAQGPVGDVVELKLDRDAMVGSHSLSPGEYTIRQITSAGNPRVLEFTKDSGTRLVATVTAIPVMQNIPPQETKIDFDDEAGGTSRIRRIWVQGKTYGYEFPREGAASTTGSSNQQAVLSGRFQAAPAPQPEVARNEPAPQPTPEPQRAPEPTPTPTPAPEPTPPSPTPAPSAEEQTPAPAPAETPSTPAVPATALGWGEFVALGMMMGVVGVLLYRKTA